jgi:hypothetical protein
MNRLTDRFTRRQPYACNEIWLNQYYRKVHWGIHIVRHDMYQAHPIIMKAGRHQVEVI